MKKIFLCHNSQDKTFVKKVHTYINQKSYFQALRFVKENKKAWLDEDEFKPGDEINQEINHQINQTNCCVIFLSEYGIGNYQIREILKLKNRYDFDTSQGVHKLDFKVIPILMPGIKDIDEVKMPDNEQIKNVISSLKSELKIRDEDINDVYIQKTKNEIKEFLTTFSWIRLNSLTKTITLLIGHSNFLSKLKKHILQFDLEHNQVVNSYSFSPVVIGGVTVAGVTSLLFLLATAVTKPLTGDKDKLSNFQLPSNFQLVMPHDHTYSMLGNFSNELAVVRKNGKSLYINRNLEETPTMNEKDFDGALDFPPQENLALAWINGQNRGYIRKNGKFKIQPKYGQYMAGSFSEGLAHVCEVSTCAYINSKGNKVIEKILDAGIKKTFTGAGRFSDDGLAPVKTDGKWTYIDKKGIVQFRPQFDQAYPFSEGLAPVKLGEQWMYIDKYGTPIPNISKDFKEITYFSEGLAAVKNKEDKWGYIDNQGKIIIEPQFDDDSNRPPKYNCDATDAEQERLSRCKYLDDRRKFSNSPPLAAIYKNGKWGYIDRQGKTIIEPKFDTANPFSEKLASVCGEEKQVKMCGYIGYLYP